MLLGVLLVQSECAVTALLAVPYFLLSIFLVIRLVWDLRLSDTASYWVTSIVLAWEEKHLNCTTSLLGAYGKGCVRDVEVLGLAWIQMHQCCRIILKLDFLHVNK